ncbi:MAG: hypothetical protein DRJ03_24330 [Chloroflexi bacterium]|nr:MAG: hypothetical protein DRJ03_24330 [Chloroflexota bacterium]
MGVDPYVSSVVKAIEDCKPWMHHNCAVWVRIGDVYRQTVSPVVPDYTFPELMGIPWRFALEFQARGWHLYTCVAIRPEKADTDHDYLFRFGPGGRPLHVEGYHKADWWLEDDLGWVRHIVKGLPSGLVAYDPYQNPKIKAIVLEEQGSWLGDT